MTPMAAMLFFCLQTSQQQGSIATGFSLLHFFSLIPKWQKIGNHAMGGMLQPLHFILCDQQRGFIWEILHKLFVLSE